MDAYGSFRLGPVALTGPWLTCLSLRVQEFVQTNPKPHIQPPFLLTKSNGC
jgi:hypothetical protein